MAEKRVPLFDRLPAIYRIKDAEIKPAGQLEAYLEMVEDVFDALHENIEALYHDLFIETCHDWVIPYIGDLLGTSHLRGDPWTLRADVADTIALRRRKGTKGAIELLTYNLTRWGVHCVELMEILLWNQHLNHQRPDKYGTPPYSNELTGDESDEDFIYWPIRGGTVTLRDPASLCLLGGPFDPFAHVVDVKPPMPAGIAYNLPNLAIFLWRLKSYQVQVSKPFFEEEIDLSATADTSTDPKEAAFLACFHIHPVGDQVQLFNRMRFDADREPPDVADVDRYPGPIIPARMNPDYVDGDPDNYLQLDTYIDTETNPLNSIEIGEMALQLYLPDSEFDANWTVRVADLTFWEKCLASPVMSGEIIVDPTIGRIIFGVDSSAEVTALEDHLLVTWCYGAPGPVGAHPVSRTDLTEELDDPSMQITKFSYHKIPETGETLQDVIEDAVPSIEETIIEINDSMTHEFESDFPDTIELKNSLTIRAADYQRPVIVLSKPLKFKSAFTSDSVAPSQLNVHLEGLYLTRGEGFPADKPLIEKADLNKLEIIGTTLDPGEADETSGERQPSLLLVDPDNSDFDQIPEINLEKSISGPIFINPGYRLVITDSIIDAGSGVHDDPLLAVSNADDPESGWGPPVEIDGATIFGSMRVEWIEGKGGIFIHSLQVKNSQKGCIKYSYFSGINDILPQNHACVDGIEAPLYFVSETFGHPAYAQLARSADVRIREKGPGDNAMGAYGFLLEADKWRNLQIRYREFMPVGVKPLLIPVT